MAYIAFEGSRRIASGDLPHVAAETKAVLDRGERAPVLIFDGETSELTEVDFRGSIKEVQARLTNEEAGAQPAKGPGRPKLGVVAREVTLLPRHWEWLSSQPGGASVALRKLVENARKSSATKDQQRKAQEATYRFLTAVAGNEPGFEEALRALFAGNRQRFEELAAGWPVDVGAHANQLATHVWES